MTFIVMVIVILNWLQLVLVNPVGEVMEKLQKADGTHDLLQPNVLFLTVGEAVSSLFSSMKGVSSSHV